VQDPVATITSEVRAKLVEQQLRHEKKNGGLLAVDGRDIGT
jgi:cytidylate kinase